MPRPFVPQDEAEQVLQMAHKHQLDCVLDYGFQKLHVASAGWISLSQLLRAANISSLYLTEQQTKTLVNE
jgi:hypothetical protein